MEWVSVAQASDQLGVSQERVRQLAAAGELPFQRLGRQLMLDRAPVEDRARHRPQSGRPVGARLAWLVLGAMSARDPGDLAAVLDDEPDRVLRHRARAFLAKEQSSQQWADALRKRADLRSCWAHPGVIDGLLEDERVRVGGSAAAAQHGLGIASGGEHVLYVNASDGQGLAHDYRLRDDSQGSVHLRVVPAPVDVRAPGPIHVATAVADLLDRQDSRARHVAESWFDAWKLVSP